MASCSPPSPSIDLRESPHLLGGLGNLLLRPLVLRHLHSVIRDVDEERAAEVIKGRNPLSGDEGHNVDKGREAGAGIL